MYYLLLLLASHLLVGLICAIIFATVTFKEQGYMSTDDAKIFLKLIPLGFVSLMILIIGSEAEDMDNIG